MKHLLIKITFGVAMFFLMIVAFLLNGCGQGEPFWKRQCDKLIGWYDKQIRGGI